MSMDAALPPDDRFGTPVTAGWHLAFAGKLAEGLAALKSPPGKLVPGAVEYSRSFRAHFAATWLSTWAIHEVGMPGDNASSRTHASRHAVAAPS